MSDVFPDLDPNHDLAPRHAAASSWPRTPPEPPGPVDRWIANVTAAPGAVLAARALWSSHDWAGLAGVPALAATAVSWAVAPSTEAGVEELERRARPDHVLSPRLTADGQRRLATRCAVSAVTFAALSRHRGRGALLGVAHALATTALQSVAAAAVERIGDEAPVLPELQLDAA